MRIIGGQYRSRLISMPKGVKIRPTQDKVREAVFNILGDINGRNCLELFAGSGAFGMEALSRGASGAAFVDNNYLCAKTIRSNLESLGIPEALYDIIKANAISVLPRFRREKRRFDLIFLDPPYYKDIARKCLINIDSCDILSQAGLVVVEHFRKDSLDAKLSTLIRETQRVYGDTAITIFRRIRYEKIKIGGIPGDV